MWACAFLLANPISETHSLTQPAKGAAPLGVSVTRAPQGRAGNMDIEFLSRLRLKSLIETGNKNNETTRSQKSKDLRVERDPKEYLI